MDNSKTLVVVQDEYGNQTIYLNGEKLIESEGGEIYWKDVVQRLGFEVDITYMFGEEDNK